MSTMSESVTALSTLDFPRVLALGIFSSYFLSIIFLFGLIFRSLPRPHPSLAANRAKIWSFVGLMLASFAHTWYYMIEFLSWSFRKYEMTSPPTVGAPFTDRLTSWLLHTALFEQAWMAVCFDPMNWWWSAQLCLFTVTAWTILLVTAGRTYPIKHVWAYMLLGQLVAISVASNLFYLTIILSTPIAAESASTRQRKAVSSIAPLTWFPILSSLLTIILMPYTDERTFLPNLLLMHALLFIPLFGLSSPPSQPNHNKTRLDISLQTFHWLIMIPSILIYISTADTALSPILSNLAGNLPQNVFQKYSIFFRHAWDTLHSHPAQASIGWDVVWTTISLVVWLTTRPFHASSVSVGLAPFLILSVPFFGLGSVVPLFVLCGGEMIDNTPAENTEKK